MDDSIRNKMDEIVKSTQFAFGNLPAANVPTQRIAERLLHCPDCTLRCPGVTECINRAIRADV